MRESDTLVFIPTYNERENVEKICMEIIALGLQLDLLFLDDHSPDGTGQILDELAKKFSNVTIIHRSGKLGIGSAHLDGILWAYDHGYSRLITMDCDFTHSPEYLPAFIGMSETDDVIIGSRYLQRKSLQRWNLFRKSLTLTGHFLTKYFLKIKYDATGAYRLYRLDRIPRQTFDLVHSTGYSFFFESIYILSMNQFSIKEIPIHLPVRTYGHSKMSLRNACHSVFHLVHIYLISLISKEAFEICEPFLADGSSLELMENQQWNVYWKNKRKIGGIIYDLIAVFYRKFIIKPCLNHFISKYFRQGEEVLHAGCGSGQVDVDIRNRVSITALDISSDALSIYKKINKNSCKIIHGDLFAIPLDDEFVDGIYNLGVMEHFTESEIQEILHEFYRVLKTNGRMIIFWPPEFGLSVIFLKVVRSLLGRILKKNPELYPDEITLVKSKSHIRAIFEEANFSMIDYYFGVRDFFTHSVIVLAKKTP